MRLVREERERERERRRWGTYSCIAELQDCRLEEIHCNDTTRCGTRWR